MFVQEPNSRLCLDVTEQNKVSLRPCTQDTRWRASQGAGRFRHVTSGLCLEDSGGMVTARPCNSGWTQAFEYATDMGAVRIHRSWADNGRQRHFERCLDREPRASRPVRLAIRSCPSTRRLGVHWERIGSIVPEEIKAWRRAQGTLHPGVNRD